MPVQSKAKGNRVEREFAKLFTDRFKQTFRRVPASGAHGTQIANTDIREDAKEILTGDLICPKGFRFSIEIKSRKEFNFWDLLNRETKCEIHEWIEQAENEARVSRKDFLIIAKINNRKPFVVFDAAKIGLGLASHLLFNNGYGIIRLDNFLELPDTFFWKDKKYGTR